MAPAEIQCLFTAVINARGECVCHKCAPWTDDHAPYRQNFNGAPVLTIDPAMPILGVCPECGAKYQVPAATAIALLAARMEWIAAQLWPAEMVLGADLAPTLEPLVVRRGTAIVDGERVSIDSGELPGEE